MNFTTTETVKAQAPELTASMVTARIDTVVGWVNAIIPDYCGRVFDLLTYRHWDYLSGSDMLILPQFPINGMVYIGAGTKPAFTLAIESATVLNATAHVNESQSLTIRYFTLSGGWLEYTKDLTTLNSIAALISAIQTGTGNLFSGTLHNDFDPAALRPGLLDLARGDSFEIPAQSIAWARHLRLADGIVYLNMAVTGDIYCHYKAGYATAPAELAEIATAMVVSVLAALPKDAALDTESIADYSVKQREIPQVLQSFKPLLDRWRNHRL